MVIHLRCLAQLFTHSQYLIYSSYNAYMCILYIIALIFITVIWVLLLLSVSSTVIFIRVYFSSLFYLQPLALCLEHHKDSIKYLINTKNKNKKTPKNPEVIFNECPFYRSYLFKQIVKQLLIF